MQQTIMSIVTPIPAEPENTPSNIPININPTKYPNATRE